MPLPKAVARFNKRVTNHVTGPFASHLPGFGVITHTGRRSGRTYRTPVNVFRRGSEYVVALTYGAGAEWVRNVESAGTCELKTRGHTVKLVEPRRFTDPSRQAVPAAVRAVLGVLDVDEFLSLRPAAGSWRST
jgi:deazaflavin-dependent oxidoreductase (nitroreductase family)